MADQAIQFAYPQREHEALRAEIERAVSGVLRSGAYILGPAVRSFEDKLAEFTGVKHAVGVSSGTDALVCALLALGIGPQHEVIVPSFGFIAAAEAVVRVGARPVFVDVEPDTLGPDVDACRCARSDATRALIVMHLFGQAVDLRPLRDALPGLPIVEDAAQAIGTTMSGVQVGSMADVGTFSFFPAKSLGAAGDAGAVITNDAHIAGRVASARVHGATGPYRWESAGGNYRIDAVQAAILTVKLDALNQRLARRMQIGQKLAAALERKGWRVMSGGACCGPTFAPLAIRSKRRDALIAYFRKRNVDARVHYPVTLAAAPVFRDVATILPSPEAERATRELLSLPCCPELSDDDVAQLSMVIEEADVD